MKRGLRQRKTFLGGNYPVIKYYLFNAELIDQFKIEHFEKI